MGNAQKMELDLGFFQTELPMVPLHYDLCELPPDESNEHWFWCIFVVTSPGKIIML